MTCRTAGSTNLLAVGGQRAKSAESYGTSVLLPKADQQRTSQHVGLVPQAEIVVVIANAVQWRGCACPSALNEDRVAHPLGRARPLERATIAPGDKLDAEYACAAGCDFSYCCLD